MADALKEKREGLAKKLWLQRASASMKKRGTEGEFTAKAKRAGFTKKDGTGDAQAYARHVLANKDDFDEETIKQAQFALNMGKIAKKKEE